MKRSLPVIGVVSALVLSLLVVFAGCGGNDADDSKALEGKTWKATEITGVSEVVTTKGNATTAVFAAGTIAGSGAVNRYSGPYTTGPGNTIEFGAFISTQMAGEPAAMAQEQAYFGALQKATTYTVSELSAGATYYFAATAYDSARTESSFSNETAYTVPATCTNTITPTSQVIGAGGGTGSINVASSGTCSWTTSNTSSWVAITSGASGTGNGTVWYSVSANTGTAARTAGLTVAGNIFTVNQSGVQATYTITATAGANGSISPAGASTVPAGASQAFTISPAAGYKIQNVSVDGASVGQVSSYTFTNVRANHTIQATFKQLNRSKTTRVAN